ncbi:hypothetical protein TNCV_2448471 [Trichonephila clavipes]|uniref:Uncharacterized protein n=1 Tax=Trichonephila clavipes TaxID=2585209 RepID=A0A8X6SG46_TRICX|nr:hypothetical protein TNCV_2448471 [Trichonephila clavipes]
MTLATTLVGLCTRLPRWTSMSLTDGMVTTFHSHNGHSEVLTKYHVIPSLGYIKDKVFVLSLPADVMQLKQCMLDLTTYEGLWMNLIQINLTRLWIEKDYKIDVR